VKARLLVGVRALSYRYQYADVGARTSYSSTEGEVSAASDYLNEWLLIAQQRSPSITRVTCQRWPGVGPPPNFKPGIASYGWGINGEIITDPSGNQGLRFETNVWFSDRGLDLSNAPPDCGQQFISNQSDLEVMQLTVADPLVILSLTSLTWGNEWSATTETLDEPSQQLIFSGIPGAGPGAPPAMMLVSLADTGAFGWL
jgi:hypothetical protein